MRFSAPIFVALVSLAYQASASCIHGTSFHRREVSEEGKVEVSKFGYSGTQGPLNWAGLDPANQACATSKVQSPIVIDDSVPFATDKPEIDFPTVEEAEFENLGSTVEVVVEGTTKFAGKEFKLKQFHFHTPSEHRINDEYFPVEIHMVHEGDNGAIAVIALPFQLTEDGSTTELLTSVIKNIDKIQTPGTVTKTGKLDFGPLKQIVESKKLFQYTGSLTTPPCAEGLTFLVLSEPLPINVATFNTLKKTIKFNARYSQNKLGETNLLDVAAQLAAEKKLISNAVCQVGENKSNQSKNENNMSHSSSSSSMKHETKTAEATKASSNWMHGDSTTTIVNHKPMQTSSHQSGTGGDIRSACENACKPQHGMRSLERRSRASH